MNQPKTATIAQIREMLARGETVSLRRRYVAQVLDGLGADPVGTQQYLVKPRPGGMTDIVLERSQ
ncbi:hypothetical protein [Pseudomonas sp. PARCl1]|uniref:hypothetical protein n=1 Tax=Pseudomonas sp. PARCl1 TaxID=2853444 RepID=UPI001C76C1A6|nr:hypothetical protein [Pseudomonas sp. PARCl1]QXM18696.1 hypothetical protein [Pseudomonas phage PARCL1pr]